MSFCLGVGDWEATADRELVAACIPDRMNFFNGEMEGIRARDEGGEETMGLDESGQREAENRRHGGNRVHLKAQPRCLPDQPPPVHARNW